MGCSLPGDDRLIVCYCSLSASKYDMEKLSDTGRPCGDTPVSKRVSFATRTIGAEDGGSSVARVSRKMSAEKCLPVAGH